MSGPVLLVHGETEDETRIGDVELIYFAGSRAVNNGLNIVDVSDSVGYHCGAVVVKSPGSETGGSEPEMLAESEPAYGVPFELRPTNHPSIWAVSV